MLSWKWFPVQSPQHLETVQDKWKWASNTELNVRRWSERCELPVEECDSGLVHGSLPVISCLVEECRSCGCPWLNWPHGHNITHMTTTTVEYTHTHTPHTHIHTHTHTLPPVSNVRGVSWFHFLELKGSFTSSITCVSVCVCVMHPRTGAVREHDSCVLPGGGGSTGGVWRIEGLYVRSCAEVERRPGLKGQITKDVDPPVVHIWQRDSNSPCLSAPFLKV